MAGSLGVNQALSGNQEAALHYLNQVLSAPTSFNSRWIEPANGFFAGLPETNRPLPGVRRLSLL